VKGDLDQVLEALRREYIADGPARLAELRKDLAAFMAGEPDAAESLKSRFHRLAGSGGSYMQRAPWLSTFPGLAILLTVLAINLVGDRLRDALDPRVV